MQRGIKIIHEPSSYHSKITDWPKNERPREKLLDHGPASLSDAELLAILIRIGSGKITAVDLAKALLKEYESLERLTCKSIAELQRFHGLGEAKAIALIAAFELGRRAASVNRTEKFRINSPEDVVRRFQPFVRDLKHEIFKVILLDSANHYLRDVTVSEGILNSSVVHPREVFHPAILEPAASIILLHNHPSGNREPSSEDIQVTKQMVEAGKIIGIPVQDHIIITDQSYTSLAERGIL